MKQRYHKSNRLPIVEFSQRPKIRMQVVGLIFTGRSQYGPTMKDNCASLAASGVIEQRAAGYNLLGNPRPAVTAYVSSHELNEGTFPSLAVLVRDISVRLGKYGSLAKMPADPVGNTRNDMYLASEAICLLMKDKASDLRRD